MEPLRRTAMLAAWTTMLVAIIAGFAALGSGALAGPRLTAPATWADWAASRHPIEATVALLRLVVLGLAWYLLAVTVVGTFARLCRAAAVIRLSDAVTLPAVRRLLQAAVGVGVATAVVGAAAAPLPALRTPAYAAEQRDDDRGPAGDVAGAGSTEITGTAPLPLVLLDRGSAEPAPGALPGRADEEADVAGGSDGRRSDGRLEHPAPHVAPVRSLIGGPATAAAAAAAAADEPGSVSGAAGVHTVRAGDSIWSIATRTLEAAWGRPPTDAEVVPYVDAVIARNRDVLVDPDNPDLILPGQRFHLPAPPDAQPPPEPAP